MYNKQIIYEINFNILKLIYYDIFIKHFFTNRFVARAYAASREP